MARLVLLICLLFSQSLFAQSSVTQTPDTVLLPKYEVGFALGSFYLPDYPGSDDMKGVILPLPYIIYRGDIFRADREGGYRGRFYRAVDFELDLSFGAGFPSNSEENTARDGMNELDWIGEIGPRAKWFLLRNPMAKLEFSLPVRYVFSVDFPDSRHRGFVFNPEFILRHRVTFWPSIRMGASLGFTHASKKLMEYFYTVEPQYATSERPAFQAEDGFFSSNISVFMAKTFRKSKVNLFGGVSHSNYANNKNVDSPLLKDKYTWAYFLGLTMGIYESEEQGFK